MSRLDELTSEDARKIGSCSWNFLKQMPLLREGCRRRLTRYSHSCGAGIWAW